MGIFGFNKKPSKLKITEADRMWVEENFSWLLKVYGYPTTLSEQILLNEKYFPNTFSSKNIITENIVKDLCHILGLDPKSIKIDIIKDISDSVETPYSFDSPFVEMETIETEEGYKINISSLLLKTRSQLILNLIIEIIGIKLMNDNLKYDTGEDSRLFIYLAGIFFGFGVILSQSLIDVGIENDGMWERKWTYFSEMPKEIIAFGLALDSILIKEQQPNWLNELPKSIRKGYEGAMLLLNENPSSLFNEAELKSNEYFKKSIEEYENGDYDAANIILEKIIPLTNNAFMKADVYNNIGYNLMRKGNLNESIPIFSKAIEYDPSYAYPYDNLGYVLIRIGQFEEGKAYLEKAMKIENNDYAYTYRNLALYFLGIGDMGQAKLNFDKAFEQGTEVDLLEFHYAEFLFGQGEKNEGLKYLQIAVDKGEHEAIQKLKELKS